MASQTQATVGWIQDQYHIFFHDTRKDLGVSLDLMVWMLEISLLAIWNKTKNKENKGERRVIFKWEALKKSNKPGEVFIGDQT